MFLLCTSLNWTPPSQARKKYEHHVSVQIHSVAINCNAAANDTLLRKGELRLEVNLQCLYLGQLPGIVVSGTRVGMCKLPLAQRLIYPRQTHRGGKAKGANKCLPHLGIVQLQAGALHCTAHGWEALTVAYGKASAFPKLDARVEWNENVSDFKFSIIHRSIKTTSSSTDTYTQTPLPLPHDVCWNVCECAIWCLTHSYYLSYGNEFSAPHRRCCGVVFSYLMLQKSHPISPKPL